MLESVAVLRFLDQKMPDVIAVKSPSPTTAQLKSKPLMSQGVNSFIL